MQLIKTWPLIITPCKKLQFTAFGCEFCITYLIHGTFDIYNIDLWAFPHQFLFINVFDTKECAICQFFVLDPKYNDWEFFRNLIFLFRVNHQTFQNVVNISILSFNECLMISWKGAFLSMFFYSWIIKGLSIIRYF